MEKARKPKPRSQVGTSEAYVEATATTRPLLRELECSGADASEEAAKQGELGVTTDGGAVEDSAAVLGNPRQRTHDYLHGTRGC